MLSKQSSPSAFSRYRRPFYAMGAAAIAVPLMLSSTAAAYAQAAPPADAIEAITSGTLLPDFQHDYLEQVNSENIWQNDVKLSDEIGPRLRGTPAELEAVNWVTEKFESYGMQTTIEEFPVTAQMFADVEPSRTNGDFASWQFRPAANGPLTGVDAPVRGQLIDIGAETTGLATRTDLAGKIVLANNITGTPRTTLLTDLKAAGVAAVVFVTATGTSESLPSVANLPTGLTDMYVVGAALNQGKRMRALLAEGDLSLSIVIDRGTATSHNAIGVIPAASGNPDAPIIYLGAHIDSVLGSPGASDNGSGVSIMLEIARIMSQYSYDAEIRFGAWGAEESGYQGSNYHVKTVMTQAEQQRTLGAWNMDMAGTAFPGNPGQEFKFWALTADPPANGPLRPDQSTVLDFSNQVSVLTGNGDLPIGTVSRSDHQPFHDVGIKAAVFSWMHWAGGSTIILEPAYHMTTDTLEFVSEERMGHAARILGGGAFRAALSAANVVVTDPSGDPAANAKVAMSCEGDEGWRDAGVTDAEGKVTTLTPNTSCDFVALTDDGARGLTSGVAISAAAEDIAIELEASGDPVIAFSSNPTPSASGWLQASPSTVFVSASNEFGDAIAIEYSLDGQTWQEYVDGVTFTEQGEQALFVRATDQFGNETESVQPVNIDSVAPALQVTADAKKRGAVSGTASDDTSGVSLVQYRIGNGDWVDVALADQNDTVAVAAFAPVVNTSFNFAVDVKLGAEAAKVQFRAFDTAGNVTESGALNFSAVPGGGLPNTGAEIGMTAGIAAATLLLASGGAILIARRVRAQRVNEEA